MIMHVNNKENISTILYKHKYNSNKIIKKKTINPVSPNDVQITRVKTWAECTPGLGSMMGRIGVYTASNKVVLFVFRL